MRRTLPGRLLPGPAVDGSCRYNLIRLYSNGNVRVMQRRISLQHGSNYETEREHFAMDPQRLRVYRHSARRRHFVGAQHSASTPAHHAHADSVARTFRLRKNGGAEVEVRFQGVRPVLAELARIRLHSLNSADAFDQDSCSVEIVGRDGDHARRQRNSVAVRCESTAGNEQRSTLFVVFDPPLQREDIVDVTVRYTLNGGAFLFARQASETAQEYVFTRCNSVFPDYLHQSVVFPASWRPPSNPWVRVHDEKERDDREETRFARTALLYLEKEGVVTLAVDRPLPGLYYGILWEIGKKTIRSRRGLTPRSS